ncbi:MAG: SEC-C domain-containing protein [Gemmataceae bacterium]|nr:SEC-C domain-containing protein [Gemmataceae bacterium]
MERPGVGRNDPCPCGSGRKFKKCCLARGGGVAVPALRAASSGPASATRQAPPPRLAPAPPPEARYDGPEPPDPATAEVLPVEIGIEYTYPEPFGIAEVTRVLPAGRIYQLADGRAIVNDDLQPGMQIVLHDGSIGTLSAVRRFYDPPDPPIQVGPGLYAARVVGTIKHRGIETVDVSWPGNTVTGSPDHKFYSVSRGGYVGAAELRVGEILQTDDGRFVPVTSVGERKLGLIDLYNIEVEQFHTYHVGQGRSVLVHNGAEGTYSNPPLDKGPSRQRNGKRREYMGQNPNKDSSTYDAVVARMRQEGKIVGEGADAKVLASNREWIPLKSADLSHAHDAVKWWNEVGRFTGPKSPEVRKFMTDPNNYTLDLPGANRSAGARLGQRYLPPEVPPAPTPPQPPG